MPISEIMGWKTHKLKQFQGQAEAHTDTLGLGDKRLMLTVWADLGGLYMAAPGVGKPLIWMIGQTPSLESS